MTFLRVLLTVLVLAVFERADPAAASAAHGPPTRTAPPPAGAGSAFRGSTFSGSALFVPAFVPAGAPATHAAFLPSRPSPSGELVPEDRRRSGRPVGGYRWPLDGTPPVLRRFEPPPQPWLSGHRGVDLAGSPGATVRAAGAGVVVFAGQIAGRGVVSVRHSTGLRTTYEPVDAAVTAGSPVAAGTPLGTLAAGHPGCPAAGCLHWGLRDDARYYDPLLLLGLGRVRLLPLRD